MIVVSTSGGATSGYMAYMLKQAGHDIRCVFANTGKEHEDTLRFVRDLSDNFDLDIQWIEAVVHHGERVGTTHQVVDYHSASRNAEPYKEVIRKYGIPNAAFPHCTRETKLRPIKSWVREQGLEDAQMAVGIRVDEKRRVARNPGNIIYPLIDMFPTYKWDVMDFWEEYGWRLQIPEWQGNCTTCFKKSDKKLAQVYRETPHAFDFNLEMEAKHGRSGNRPTMLDGYGARFFRGNRSTEQMIQLFESVEDYELLGLLGDGEGACSESCEMFQMELIDSKGGRS